ncbi:hypothetical protein KY310_03680 [Candidatus Woesearchaeota archaeon]|nr:hypothetical protein [Candidatus Woesearchaeota archaeon]
MKLEDSVATDERARSAVCRLKEIYVSPASLQEKVDAQKAVFELLMSLEKEGHDTTPYFNEVVDILIDYNSPKSI